MGCHVYVIIQLISYIQKQLCFYNVDYSDCSTALATIQKQNVKLLHLPVNTLLPSFYAYNVVTFDQKEHIEELLHRKDRMSFIVDLIIRSLECGVADLYNRFLKVLKESEDLPTKELAKKLGKLLHL